MRFKALVLAFASLSVMASPAQTFELGPQLALSSPTGRAGNSWDAGISAGVTATFMENPIVGMGLDVGYNRWPGSPSANAAADEFFTNLSGGIPITGSKFTLTAFQAMGHAKLVAPVHGRLAPWIQVGAGVYRVNVSLKLPEVGWDVVNPGSLEGIHYEFGWMGGIGLDSEESTRMRFGLHATYHYMQTRDESGGHFTFFAIGAHVLFGTR